MSSRAHSFDYLKRVGSPIVATATAIGGPVVIIRVSGNSLEKFSPLVEGEFPKDKKATLRKVAKTDEALCLFFKGPASFTGEDVLEIHSHGVRSVIEKIIQEFIDLGAQIALPGEFSFRAVHNERMTLQQAEWLNRALSEDRIGVEEFKSMVAYSAEEEKRMNSIFHNALEALRKARARLESAIDFPEAEEEQSGDVSSSVQFITELKSQFEVLLSSNHNFNRNSSEKVVTILGQPNVGKSTLFNLLSGGEKAIVSSQAGTTRDVLESRVLIGGHWWRLVDTAGMRDIQKPTVSDEIELLGMQRARELLDQSDVILKIRRSEEASESSEEMNLDYDKNKEVLLYSHADLSSAQNDSDLEASFDFRKHSKEIRNYLERRFAKLNFSDDQKESFFLSERQRRLIESVNDLVEKAKTELEESQILELAADRLREAESLMVKLHSNDLGDEYIGEIFSQFCLGK